MIGPRVGIKVGPKVGPAVGIGTDQIAPQGSITWTVDATKAWACPADATEFAALVAYYGLNAALVPSHIYLYNEASGNIDDKVGAIDLVPEGIRVDYNITDAAWTRKVCRSRGDAFLSTSASLGDANAESYLEISYHYYESIAASTKMLIGVTQPVSILTLATTGRLRLTSAGSNQGDGTTDQTGSWLVAAVQSNRSGNYTLGCTLDTKITGALGSLAGKRIYPTGGAQTTGMTLAAYSVIFRGAAAEVNATDLKALITALATAPSWTP